MKSGCLYMMAWGHECSSWDDSVDMANLEEFDYADIPDDSFILTTWHSDQPVEEVFWFAKHNASHRTLKLDNLVILHIGEQDKSELFRSMYVNA